MKKKLMLGAAIGALAGATPLMAADLPAKAPMYKAVPVPVYSWTGCYAGVNVGGSWGRSSGFVNTPDLSSNVGFSLPSAFDMSSKPTGAIGGVQIGCDRQVDRNWVLGVEADIQGSGQKATRTFSAFNSGGEGVSGNIESRLRWFGTVRGIAGFLVTPTVMLYGTGGLAYGNATINANIVATECCFTNFATSISSSTTNVGYTVGAGIKGVFPGSPNLTWKLEYLYVDLGSISASGINPIIGPYSYSARITDNIVRIGVDYKFYDWSAGPVVAKY